MNANPMQKTVLVVDDDPDLLKLLALRLTAAGYSAQTAESGERALAVIAVPARTSCHRPRWAAWTASRCSGDPALL
jgi:CheY-like chemotaxis protein